MSETDRMAHLRPLFEKEVYFLHEGLVHKGVIIQVRETTTISRRGEGGTFTMVTISFDSRRLQKLSTEVEISNTFTTLEKINDHLFKLVKPKP